MKARRPEDKLQDEIRAKLGSLPGVIIMRNAVSYATRTGHNHPELFGLGLGTPDLVCIVRGRMVGLELKGRHTGGCKCASCGAQRRCMGAWRAAGAVYEVVRSLEEARAVLLKESGA